MDWNGYKQVMGTFEFDWIGSVKVDSV